MAFRLALKKVARKRSSIFAMAESQLGEPTLNQLAARMRGSAAHVEESLGSLDELKARFSCAAASGTLNELAPALWDRLPNALTHGTPPILLRNREVVGGLRLYVRSRHAHRCLRNLVAYYLRDFQPDDSDFRAAASILKEAMVASPEAYPRWYTSEQKFDFFDPDLAPKRVAQHCLRFRTQIPDSLEDAGATKSLTSKFAVAALSAALQLVSENLASASDKPVERGDLLQQLGHWLTEARHAGVVTVALQCEIALRILSPWDSRRPSNSLRKFLTKLILEYVGDPREDGLIWTRDELQTARERLLNWLAYGTIERFFEVIDASAQEAHWTERRQFWASYADKGVVTDAWVAYGPVAQRLARQVKDPSFQFGRLENARLRDHSALLLRIGTMAVADYSHNGSCRFFPAGAWQPKFYLSSYNDAELRYNAKEALIHHVNWQWKFAQYIRRHTGIGSRYEGNA